MAETTTAAKKKATPKKREVAPTSYQVQRVFTGGIRAAIAVGEHPDAKGTSAEDLELELWEDVAVIETSQGGEKACKLAAAQLGEGDREPMPGRFRAFPSRSDSRLDVQAQQQMVVTYSKPTAAPSPAPTPAQGNGGT